MSSLGAAIILASLGTQPGAADEVASFTLPHGDYVADAYSCDDFPMAGILGYDGRGFSPNHVTCTTAPGTPAGMFHSTCTDNTDKSTQYKFDVKIAQLSGNRVQYDGNTYNYCKAK